MALFGGRAAKLGGESSQSPMSTGALNAVVQGV